MTPQQKRNRGIAAGILALVVLLLLIASCGGSDDSTPDEDAQTLAPATTAAETTESASPPDPVAEQRQQAVLAEAEKRYDDAIALYVELDDEDNADRVKRKAAKVMIRRARSAYRAGKYVTAERRADAAIRRYGRSNSAGATRISNDSSAALRAREEQRKQAARARADARRAAREQRRAAQQAADAAEAAAEAESYDTESYDDYDEPPYDAPSSGGRAGCNPATARDGDGDGVVCE
jgi:outer membrane protein assembly factor BamD (BamD/ComL family)